MLRGVHPIPVALLVCVLAGCSSPADQAADVELRWEGYPVSTPSQFTASGAGVDEGVMCEAGDAVWTGEIRTVDGQPTTLEEFEASYYKAEGTKGVHESVWFTEFRCADEDFAGSFTIRENVWQVFRRDAETGELRPAGTWEIYEGTGDFAEIAGGGDVFDHSHDPTLVYTGQVTLE
jgi:hypothetical protein